MPSFAQSHVAAGWRHLLFHAPYKPIDVLLITALVVTTPVILFLTAGDNLLGYTTRHGVAWCSTSAVTTQMRCATSS